jgi:hypothetical protein
MKIWEVHALQFNGAIRTTADGDADVSGLLLSEKAYLHIVRDFGPGQLVELVREHGIESAREALIRHYGAVEAIASGAGRSLVSGRSRMGDPVLLRTDEAPVAVAAPSRGYPSA